MNILVCFNKFSSGGRETFFASHAAGLGEAGFRFELLTNEAHSGAPGLECFDSIHETGGGPEIARWRRWLELGGEVIGRFRPQVIWAHHFELLPVWLLSRLNGIPMVATFHGPLTGDNRPNPLLEAAGMLLAICRGDVVTGVSPECAGRIRGLGGGEPLLTPNAVPMSDGVGFHPPAGGIRRLLVVARFSKLEHLRAAVRFHAEYRVRQGNTTLTIIGGDRPDVAGEDTIRFPMRFGRKAAAVAGLLGAKWCLAQGAAFLKSLMHVKIQGFSDRVPERIREHDAVIGMGRVVLEALAEGRPAVLAGYDGIVDVITRENFQAAGFANFSGRGMPSLAADDAAVRLRDFTPEKFPAPEQLREVSTLRRTPELAALLHQVAETHPGSPPLARALVEILSEANARSRDVFARLHGDLNTSEAACLYDLATG